MAYNRTTWTDGASPPISAANLNIIELGIVGSLPMDGVSPMTGQLKTIAGSAGTPSISPTGDPNTGIYFPLADTIGFGEGGAEVMRITSGGSVGIGVSTAQAKLQVNVAGTETAPGVSIRHTGTGSNVSSSLWLGEADAYTLRIGKLGVAGGTYGTYAGYIDNVSSNLVFALSGTEYMRLSTTALSIGTSLSTGKIAVQPSIIVLENPSSNAAAIALDFDSSIARVRTTAVGTSSGFPLAFFTDTTERMRITIGGSVGIGGIQSPSRRLEVAGGGSFSDEVRVKWFDIGTGPQTTQNIRIGNGLGSATVGGYANIAIGSNTLLSNTSGTGNMGIGGAALTANTTGSGNAALGLQALAQNTTGGNNCSVGYFALYGSTNTTDNVAIGPNTLYSTANTASGLVAVGASALAANTTGTENVAIGFQSLRLNTTGGQNTAVGYNALRSNTAGSANVAIGRQALFAVTTGNDNFGLGYNALYGITNASSNIAIGSNAGSNITTGANNTIIGGLSGVAALSSTVLLGAGTTERLKVDSTGAFINGSTYAVFTTAGGAIGGTVTPSVNNAYELGSATNRWSTIYSQNALNVSDERLKTEIINSRLGLDFISNLRPVEYKFIEGRNILSTDENGSLIVTSVPGVRTHFGLIAQELKQSLPQDLDFAGWCLEDKENPDSLQSIGYTELIAPMIKAIQELNQKVKDLELQLANK